MSSLVRTLEKRALKAKGFYRNKLGMIVDQNGKSYGPHWPKKKEA